jgi:sortase A
MRRVIPLFLLFAGISILGSVLLPVGGHALEFFLFPSPELLDPTRVSAYPAPVVVTSLGTTSDFTSASNWFNSTVSLPPAAVTPITFFTLSVPRLKMQNVPVQINGSDLKKNAIHYPGTSLPGDYGNTVIFGHSALPQFYRPGNPLTIFNPLIKAKIGDDIHISYDSVSYHYSVRSITEVKPSQIEVLAQNFSRHELTLITCTPLGTYWLRFVVRAELVK